MGFSFKQFAPSAERTARFTLDTVSEDPSKPIVLELRYAGEGNRAYLSAALKGAKAASARSGRGHLTPSALQMAREEDAALFARHIVVGWENVLDGDRPAPCTPEMAEAFLLALADARDGRPDVFDAIRVFASNPENFREPVGSADALGKK